MRLIQFVENLCATPTSPGEPVQDEIPPKEPPKGEGHFIDQGFEDALSKVVGNILRESPDNPPGSDDDFKAYDDPPPLAPPEGGIP